MPPAPEPLRVLVADDRRDVVDSVVVLLRLWGHEPVAAYDVASAAEASRLRRPHVALLDLAMPSVRDGYDLARRLRPEVRLLVAVTGCTDAESRRLCAAAGYDLVTTKPLDPAWLHALLAEVARRLGAARCAEELPGL